MKQPAFLKEENLLTLYALNNFIIPEIQREYVWGNNKDVINKFLRGLVDKIGPGCSKCHLPSAHGKINIGFLYSYKPDYVKIKHERFLDENLIDGQQRFTTLFLLIFFCALQEGKKDEFFSLIRFETGSKMGFDFKVRDLTRRFMLEMLEKTESVEELTNLENQSWFLADYRTDQSISSMLNALNAIAHYFCPETHYFHYLLTNIVFWHFKTEATSQGEELYITMNARGEQLASNEITKAALMMEGKDIYKWGVKWENWQQLFWRNRVKTISKASADYGFNTFLACIAGLEYYLIDVDGGKAEQDIPGLLNLPIVEKYVNALNYLFDHKEAFKVKYPYAGWIDKCTELIWNILNTRNTNWFAGYRDENRGNERNQMIFMWSFLYYISERQRRGLNDDEMEIFRVLRLFYVRFNNYNRSVSTLKQTVHFLLSKGVWSNGEASQANLQAGQDEETELRFKTSEEEAKYNYLKGKQSDPSHLEIESLIWEIEDMPLNLDGRDVGAINMTHLLDFSDEPDLLQLRRTLKTYKGLFSDGYTQGTKHLKSILLHYGIFYREAFYRYRRYDFSDWKRNIRKPAFKQFIKDIGETSPVDFLQHKIKEFLIANNEIIRNAEDTLPDGNLRHHLLYYSVLLGPFELWKEGEKMIYAGATTGTRLFADEHEILYNSKGTFHGYTGYSDIWDDALRLHQNGPLQAIKIKAAVALEQII